MLLQQLKEYNERRMEAAPSLYAMTPIAGIVELSPDGTPLSRHLTVTMDPSTPRGKRGIDRLAPEVVRTSGPKPLLLADNGEYTFGLSGDGGRASGATKHELYRSLLQQCATVTGEGAVRAVEGFFANGGVERLEFDQGWDPGLKVTFRVHLPSGPTFPIDLESVRAFWLDENRSRLEPERCHICGEIEPPVGAVPVMLKGIHGGQSSGTAMISVNGPAFVSYGLERQNGVPTCLDCGEKFTRALNSLIAGEQTHLYVGDSTFAFWTREPTEFNWTGMFSDPDPATVQALIDSVRSGKPITEADESAFYAVALSGSGGRAVVRDWIDTTVGAAATQIARWFEHQAIVDPYGEAHRPLGVYALAASTVRRIQDLPATTPRTLLHAAFTGAPINQSIAFEAVRRNRAEQTVTRPRAALIKLVLLSHETGRRENFMVQLEADHPDIAYQCGRLLAVLEQAQRAALPGVSATIIDRFFGTASSAPASVFSRLLRGAQPHLAKLERDRPGAHVALQRRLEEVLGHIPGKTGFPKTLSLQQQALFSLGYYHQRADDRAQATARRAELNLDPTTSSTEDSNE